MSETQLLNTHYYDGRMQERIKSIETEIQRARLVPQGAKAQAFEWLREKIFRHPYASFGAKRCFDAIHTSFKNGGSGNFDPANQLYADDLLFLCYERIMNKRLQYVEDALDHDDVRKDRVLYAMFSTSELCYECSHKTVSWHINYFPYFEKDVLSLLNGRVTGDHNSEDWYGVMEILPACSRHSHEGDDIDLCECDAYPASVETVQKELRSPGTIILLPDAAQKILGGFRIPVDDFFSALIIQLDEMASGLCPQGRTTRLLQILVSYEQTENEKTH